MRLWLKDGERRTDPAPVRLDERRPFIVGLILWAAAGAVLLASGAPGRRAVLPHTRVVLHQPAAQGRGTIPDLILQADEVVRVRAEIEGVLATHTGQSVETLRRDTDRDRLFTASDAVAYGLADSVLGAR